MCKTEEVICRTVRQDGRRSVEQKKNRKRRRKKRWRRRSRESGGDGQLFNHGRVVPKNSEVEKGVGWCGQEGRTRVRDGWWGWW